MSNRYFIFLCDDMLKFDSLFGVMLSDIETVDNTYQLYKHCNIITRKLLAHTHGHIFNSISVISCYELEKVLSSIYTREIEVNIIIFNAILKYYPPAKLISIRKKYPGIIYDLYFVDALIQGDTNYYIKLITEYKWLFKHIWSISHEDCEYYELEYKFTAYSIQNKFINLAKSEPKYGIYWGGFVKRREKLIIGILQGCKSNNVNWKFDVFVGDDYTDEFGLGDYVQMQNVHKMEDYNVILNRTLQGNCILDIVESSNRPLTVRTYEAVCYNKKLLTNNKNIFKFKYYNPEYVQYFENPEDIDYGWINCIQGVDYKYSGDFSPLNFFEEGK